MRYAIVAASVLLSLAFASATHAASFDCAKAHSRSEKMICSDPELGRLDEQVAQTYRAALSTTPRPVAVTSAQRQWVHDRDAGAADDTGKLTPLTLDEMKGRYRDRLKDLQAESALDVLARGDFAVADLKTRCVPLAISKCKVDQAGGLGAPQQFGPLWFQLQSTTDSDADIQRGVVVLIAAGPGRVRPLVWNFDEDAHFDEPKVIRSPDGWLLDLPATKEGTGVFNADVIFQRAGDHWRDVDLWTWEIDLAKRLPPGREVWKGVPYDFAHLSTMTDLWHKTDGNCCPTAGSAAVKFHIDGDRLAITSVKVSDKRADE